MERISGFRLYCVLFKRLMEATAYESPIQIANILSIDRYDGRH
jgi:hypothetical protein